MSWEIREGDALERLREMPDESVQTCATSPPFWGLRDYGVKGQLGLEPTPEEYVADLVAVFREVRRVLRDDGTLWLNLGDSYNAGRDGGHPGGKAQWNPEQGKYAGRSGANAPGLKPKDLVGIPWMVAFALRADGWYLRSDIIWAKPNPMPESVTDRPTKAHEYLFLLSRAPRYFYDAEATREQDRGTDHSRHILHRPEPSGGILPEHSGIRRSEGRSGAGRNRRSVWTVATQPFPGAHFATFPPKLIEPCILAGSPPKCCGECGAPWERIVERTPMVVTPTPKREAWQEADDHARTQVGGTMTDAPTSRTVGWRSSCKHDDDSGQALVLDPFAGAGTTGLVVLRHDRSFVGIELNPDYAEMARNRIRDDAPLLNVGAEAA